MNNMNLRQTRADQQEHHDSDFCLRKPKRSRTKNSSSNISRHTRLDDATTSANTGNSNSDSLDAQEYIQEENIISPQLQLNENFYYDNDDGDNDNIDDFSNFGNTENNRWTTRPIDLRHHHPVEYTTVQDPSRDLPIFKFFLDIYIGNAYHAIGGIYLQIGNMKQELRRKLKNHFLIGFIPFTATTDEVLQPLISNIQELEHGYELKINNQEVWIAGGLGVITSDLLEGNE
ncbi:unnamed protein product [Rhizophagus irregularis]|nr:unnamed protein product [Rhizophagus irregularis]